MADAYEAFDALLADQEKQVRQAFADFLAIVTSSRIIAEVQTFLEARNVEAALKIVDSYVNRLADVFPAISAIVGRSTAEEIAASIPGLATGVSFDPSLPRAAEIIQQHRAQFVREFSDGQRQAVTQAMERAYRQGFGTAAAGRSFRDAIGLTAYQENMVASYADQLRNRDRRALDRALRDRRFDPTVQSAIELDRPLTEKQIANMTDRYRRRALSMRSETIATTEGGRATSEAREESARQIIEQTGIDPAQMQRVWMTTKDKRRREWHATMQDQTRALEEDFVDGKGARLRYPHDPRAPADTVINCRCGLIYRVKALA